MMKMEGWLGVDWVGTEGSGWQTCGGLTWDSGVWPLVDQGPSAGVVCQNTVMRRPSWGKARWALRRYWWFVSGALPGVLGASMVSSGAGPIFLENAQ